MLKSKKIEMKQSNILVNVKVKIRGRERVYVALETY